MTIESIQQNIEKCLKHIRENSGNLPQIIKDLDYLMNQRKKDILQLTPEQQLSVGAKFFEQTVAYYLELLKKYAKDFYHITLRIEDDSMIALAGVAGYDSESDTLKVSTSGFLMGKNHKTAPLETILHEIRHKNQHDAYQKKEIKEILEYPENMILLAKENAFLKGQGTKFYQTNYEKLYTEIDADDFSFVGVRILLEDLLRQYKEQGKELTPEEEIALRKLQKIMITESAESEKENRNRQNTRTRREAMGIDPPSGEYIIKGETQDRLIAMDLYIKNNPELVLEYPILTLIMNKDYEGIIKDRTKAMEINPERAEKLYRCIIQSDPILYIEDCIRNGQEYPLQKFLKEHPTLPEYYPQELKRLAEKTNHPMIIQLLATKNTL